MDSSLICEDFHDPRICKKTFGVLIPAEDVNRPVSMAFPPLPTILGRCIAIVDPATEAVLGVKNPDLPCPIASIQKLLTALLVIERGDLDAGLEIHLDDTLCRTARAEVLPGEVYTRRTLLACMLIGSANDAALALARDHSNSVSAFVSAMNDKAASLGMTASRFFNPSGLPHDGQVSTAMDAARLAMAVDALPVLRELVAKEEFSFVRPNGESCIIRSTNKLLGAYDLCDGMKTGFTNAAGYCLVASGGIDDERRIAVILNSSADGVWSDARTLLDWSFKEISVKVPCVSV